MAQPISNTVQSSNPLAGLLTLSPKPLNSGVFNTTMSGSTPALIQPKTAPVAASVPQGNSQSSFTALTPGQFGGSTLPQNTPQASTVATTVQPAPTGNTVGYNPPANSGIFTTPNGTQVNANGSTVGGGAPVRGLFSDVASSLAYNAPTANAALGKNAQDIAAAYGREIADVGGQGARLAAGYRTTGTTPVAEGNAAVAAQTTASQQTALAQGEAAALQGNQQAITAQGQTQSALGTAGSLTQPSASFPFVFNPATGSFSSPGVGGGAAGGTGGPTITYNPQTDSKSLATAVMNHQISYNDALSALSYGSNGSNAAGQLSSAILNQGGNPSILQTQAGIQSEQEQTFQAYQSAHQQALNLQSQLSDLVKSFNLNPSDLTAANLAIQTIAKNTSDPRYQLLSNYVADVASRYSQILTPPGGTATDTTRSVASGMLNALASGSSILDVMNGLDQQAQAVASGVKTIGANGSPSSPGSYTNTGGTSSTSTGTVQTSAGAVNTNW